MVKIKDLRKKVISELQQSHNESPHADVDFVLASLGFSKSDIIIGEKTLNSEQCEKLNNALKRLKNSEPVQYIVGGCEFMSLWFQVNSSTLIPRADTEILVETLIELLKDKKANIFEVGSGSGCIAISLAKYLPDSKILSVDISPTALKTAAENAKKHEVSDRCHFEKCDILDTFPEFESLPDVVVSNPPYIPKGDIDELEQKVKNFEPLSALDGGEDGLDFYRRISRDVPLANNGILAFEVGINQASDVAELMKSRFENIQIIKDMSGIDRVVLGTKK